MKFRDYKTEPITELEFLMVKKIQEAILELSQNPAVLKNLMILPSRHNMYRLSNDSLRKKMSESNSQSTTKEPQSGVEGA
jgi:hypothetical protein